MAARRIDSAGDAVVWRIGPFSPTASAHFLNSGPCFASTPTAA
jgi:hypothetical protein